MCVELKSLPCVDADEVDRFLHLRKLLEPVVAKAHPLMNRSFLIVGPNVLGLVHSRLFWNYWKIC